MDKKARAEKLVHDVLVLGGSGFGMTRAGESSNEQAGQRIQARMDEERIRFVFPMANFFLCHLPSIHHHPIAGAYSMEPSRYANTINRVTWGSSANNMGMGINRELFEDMKKCAEHFCHFDDYNWCGGLPLFFYCSIIFSFPSAR